MNIRHESPLTQRLPGCGYSFHSRARSSPRRAVQPSLSWNLATTEHARNRHESPLTQRLSGCGTSFQSRARSSPRRPVQPSLSWNLATTQHTSNVAIGEHEGFVTDFKLARRNLKKRPDLLPDLKLQPTVGPRKPLELKTFSNVFKRDGKKKKSERNKLHDSNHSPIVAGTVAHVLPLPLEKEPAEKKPMLSSPTIEQRKWTAAILIQRIARGRTQRVNFRIARLQHMLDTQEEQTAAEIAKIQQRLQRRKDRYLQRMKTKMKAEADRIELQARTVTESQQVISYLVKENKKLRRQAERLTEDIATIKEQNSRLEEATRKTKSNFTELQDHMNDLIKVHDQLAHVIPQYKGSIRHLENAGNSRQLSCEAEHNMKIIYFSCIVTIVEFVEERCEDDNLADEVVNYCVNL